MTMADAAKIPTVPHALINLTDQTAYITKRIDQVHETPELQRKAMEDFCQLSERLTEDKYKGSYEQCIKIIRRYSSRPGIDLAEFFWRILFCFVTGNSDMHLKNFSLIETAPQSRQFMLSPAYDLLPVNCVMPADTEQTALTLNGKKASLKKSDFLTLADSAGLSTTTAQKLCAQMKTLLPQFHDLCDQAELSAPLRERLHMMLETRGSTL
mgnify:CR=1 FL=1